MIRNLVATASALALSAGMASSDAFNRISSFPTFLNNGDASAESSAEIISVSADGMTLVYSDSPLEGIGLIDITDPANPKPKGNIAVGGEPTAVSIIGNTAFVGVNTSQSFTAPSGMVKAFDLTNMEETAACDLGGQPDSTATAPDGTFIAIAIENERDEDLGDGRVGQMPGGFLVTVDVADGTLDCGTLAVIDVSGLAAVAPDDPEPEFVDINAEGEIVVTLQENNHIVVATKDGVIHDFSAGSVDLDGIDATDERGALVFTESQPGRLREPDAVQWIDDTHFAIANEGDMDGGSRGWSIFSQDGELVYESGTAFEHAIIEAGHYPDKRSDSKGVEPEGMEFGVFDGTPMAFILAERSSIVGVYDLTDPAAPVLTQLLPSGIGPEGAVAIPSRNLFVTANETDLIEDGGARSHVMIYALQDAAPAYPQLTSAGAERLIGWGALSGMVADEDGIIWAVNDSFYGFQPTIFKIDTRTTPATIVDSIPVTRRNGDAAQQLDMEGITLDGEGGFFIASEGRTERLIPHAIYHVDGSGEIRFRAGEIGLPPELMAVERRFGFEGITRIGNVLWMAVQREWQDDPADHVKLVAYNFETEEWGAVHYPKAAPATGWVGLSEIVAHGDHVYVIERDNQIGGAAVTKKIYRIPAAEMVPAPLGGALPVVSKEEVRDLIPDLLSLNGYVVDKIEGLAIFEDGTAWISTDNDGVDDSSGETYFWSPGRF
ncbi:esterase-like activity of phytase family protein [uncultured Roseobacter sp.]|uniref:esterase-like activity of phytase family protein n=1 Tax=uncultured Roseobacter sp. TaxID=114847 RepID=UPI00260D18AE|nr:esterase-like activity of phytase family protein [uncultured Roseobacter sp.]